MVLDVSRIVTRTLPRRVCHTLQREDLSSLHDQRHEGGTELPKDYSVGRGLRDARFTVAERWSVGKARQRLRHIIMWFNVHDAESHMLEWPNPEFTPLVHT